MAKQTQKKIYKSANGKVIDLDLLITRNELTMAVGNARVNARGDEIGPGGKIVRKKEDILKDYYNQNNVLVSEPLPASKSRAVADPNSGLDEDDWEEDENGDFVKK